MHNSYKIGIFFIYSLYKGQILCRSHQDYVENSATQQAFLNDLDEKLWSSADRLRQQLDAANYKHIVLGLIFLKYISDSFTAQQDKIRVELSNPENPLYLDRTFYNSDEEYQEALDFELENHIATLDQLPDDGKAHNQQWQNSNDPEPRRKAFLKAVASLKKGYALCGALKEAEAYSQEIAFYDAVRAVLAKREQNGTGGKERLIQLKTLINQSIVSEGTIDLFELLGKEQTQINLLSDDFLQAIKESETKSLWVLAMERYLKQEIKAKAARNLTAQKDFEQRLQETLNQYHNHNLSVAEILDALVQMGRDFSERLGRGEKLGLSTAELAFYDALAQNDSARELMADETLSALAKEITDILRKSVSIDWQHKEAVRARIRLLVRRALQKYKYPPDKAEEAVEFVLKQAEEIAEELSN